MSNLFFVKNTTGPSFRESCLIRILFNTISIGFMNVRLLIFNMLRNGEYKTGRRYHDIES